MTTMMKRNVLNPEEVISAWKMTQSIPVDLRRIDIGVALKIAARHNIYAYDSYFLECALSLRCPLLTLDRRMKVIAENLGIHVLEEKG
jgi:predicted nucleic acid-binding protein